MRGDWRLWAEERPDDSSSIYWWRVPEREILGLLMRPEWASKMVLCGMGLGDSEWWPPFSYWDGRRRSVPQGTEWMPAALGVTENTVIWRGLNLESCPFTGVEPKVVYHGRYIGAPPYHAEWLKLSSHIVETRSWRNAKKMRDAWNVRHKIGNYSCAIKGAK